MKACVENVPNVILTLTHSIIRGETNGDFKQDVMVVRRLRGEAFYNKHINPLFNANQTF